MNDIDAKIEKLRAKWKQNPEYRLGQLIANLTPVRFNNDPYYVEDNELLS